MAEMNWFAALADLVLVSHFLFALFVVIGFVLALVGLVLNWQWVRARSFRVLHMAAVAIVVVQAWLGMVCPLTTLESWLRMQAGEAAYEDTFIRYWVRRLLFFDAEPWVFTVIYSLVGAAVLVVWWISRPRS